MRARLVTFLDRRLAYVFFVLCIPALIFAVVIALVFDFLGVL